MSETTPSPAFVVDIGENGRPRLNVKFADRTFPFEMSPTEAGRIGKALLSAAALHGTATQPAAGTQIEEVAFNAARWKVATHAETKSILLIMNIFGDERIVFKMPKDGAYQCGQQLSAESLKDLV